MIEIPLTRGYVAIVDDEDADLTQFNWMALEDKQRKNVYAYRHNYASGKCQIVYMHRIILERKLGYAPSKHELSDHKDGNGLRNVRENIRLATHVQNRRNSNKITLPKSRLKGSSELPYGRWQSRIMTDGKSLHLGVFTDPLEAHRAYCAAAVKHHGEFCNFGGNSPFTPEDFKQ